ncbi:MAG: copper transporter, partial [Acidimicrobiales bacterium]
MINLRYHIVSITAVFLALGIGLAFGAAFIDRATVGVLDRNLDAVQRQNNDLEAENGRLSARLDDAEALEQALLEQGLPQLVTGRLDQVPVVVLAARGIDDEPVTGEGGLVDTLETAGAELGGVIWLTDRLVLDDDAERSDLATILGASVSDASHLRQELLDQLGETLAAAGSPSTPVDDVDPESPEADVAPEAPAEDVEPTPPLV